jgi:RHS repeat-associated protein
MIAFVDRIEQYTGYDKVGDPAAMAGWVAAPPTTYTYDADGNRAVREMPGDLLTTYVWNGAGRLSAVQLPTGQNVTYVYNAEGLVTDRDDGAAGDYTWDGQNLLVERGAGAPKVYTYRPGELFGALLTSKQSSVTEFYATDWLGTAGLITDGVTLSLTFVSAFGELAHGGQTSPPFRWIGELGYYYDETTGLYYIRQRWFDPVTGTFLSRDPLDFAGGPVHGVRDSGQPGRRGSGRTVGRRLRRRGELRSGQDVLAVRPAAMVLGPFETGLSIAR